MIRLLIGVNYTRIVIMFANDFSLAIYCYKVGGMLFSLIFVDF